MSAKIIRIISIVDTREYEERTDDRFYPIPGSGTEHACDRCGREHEVHAEVELEGGERATVGTGCMTASDMTAGDAGLKTMKSIAGTAKRLARTESEIRKAQAIALSNAKIRAQVEALPLPDVTSEIMKSDGITGRTRWIMADAIVYQWDECPELNEERRACLVREWREKRAKELGIVYQSPSKVRDLEEHADKLRTKIEKKLAEVQS